jgi:hypothetical protein
MAPEHTTAEGEQKTFRFFESFQVDQPVWPGPTGTRPSEKLFWRQAWGGRAPLPVTVL